MIKLIIPALRHLYLNQVGKSYNLKLLVLLCKLKLKFVVEWYVNQYIKGSRHREAHHQMVMNTARLHIAYYDTAPGREAHEIMASKSWQYAAMFIMGKVPLRILWNMAEAEPEKYPLEYVRLSPLLKWLKFKEHVQLRWFWYVIYGQFLIMGNLI